MTMTTTNLTSLSVRWPSTVATNITTTAPPVSVTSMKTLDIIVVAIYIAILVFGFSGNLMVVHYFGFHNKVRRLYHFYLIHLAVSDLISATVTSGYFVLSVVSNYTWHLGEFSCKLITLIAPVTVNVSAWILVSIAHERYRGIISPFKARLTKLQIHLTVAAIWVCSFIILTPYALSINLKGLSCHVSWKNPVYELTYAVATLIVQSLVPIFYMTFTVTRILYVLRNRMTETKARTPNSKHSNFSRNTSFMSNSYQTTVTTSSAKYNEDVKDRETERLISQRRKNGDNISCDIAKLTLQTKAKALSVPSLIISINKEGNNEVPRCFDITSKQNEFTTLKKTQSVFLLPQRLPPQVNVETPKNPICKNNSSTTRKSDMTCTTQDDTLNQSSSIRGSMRRKIEIAPTESAYKRFRKIFQVDSVKMKTNRARQQQRIAMLVVTFSVFVVCSLPYNVFYIIAIVIYDFIKDHTQLALLRNFHIWLSTLVVLNTIVNCFIYAGMDRGFQIYCKRIFTCKWYKYKEEERLRKRNRGSLSIRKY